MKLKSKERKKLPVRSEGKEKQIMSNYTFTMPVKAANISRAEVASMRVVLDEISSKNVRFLLKLKAWRVQ